MGGSDDDQEQTQTTETNPWAPAAGHGENILGMAEDLFNQQGGINGNWIDFNGPTANTNLTGSWASMGNSAELGNISNQLGNLAGQMGSALPGALDALKKAQEGYSTYDIQSLQSTLMEGKQAYLDDQNSAIMNNLEKSQADAVGSIYGQAAGGGNVGSSRTQLATGQATGNLSAQAQSTMANLASQSYDTAMNQSMSTLQNKQNAQLQAAQQGFSAANSASSMYNQQGQLQQQMYNNQMQAGLGQYNYDMMQAQMAYQNMMGQQNSGWQNLGMYNQIVGGWAGAGGTGTSTGSGGSNTGSMMSGMGSLMGGVASIGGMFMSDIQLKGDIEFLGVDENNGLNVYSWTWNEKAKELPEDMIGESTGYIAQEVQGVYPEFVHEHDSGYLYLDYAGLRGIHNG